MPFKSRVVLEQPVSASRCWSCSIRALYTSAQGC